MAYPQIIFRIATSLVLFSILYLRTHAVISGPPQHDYVERRDLVCGLPTVNVSSRQSRHRLSYLRQRRHHLSFLRQRRHNQAWESGTFGRTRGGCPGGDPTVRIYSGGYPGEKRFPVFNRLFSE
jgi:hypothetical protein